MAKAVAQKRSTKKKINVSEKHLDRTEQWQKLYELVAKKLKR